MLAWRGREGIVVQKLDFLFRRLRFYEAKYPGMSFALAWIAISLVIFALVLLFTRDGDMLRGIGFSLRGLELRRLG